MSLGIALFLGSCLFLAALVAYRLLLGRLARRAEGRPLPAVDDPLLAELPPRVLLWFHSPTCGPCRAMEPAVRTLTARGLAIPVDVRRHLPLARACGVLATPTTILVDGGTLAAIRIGPAGLQQLEALLDRATR